MTAIRGRIIPEPAPQEHHTAESSPHANIYYRNIFCSILREKAARQSQVTGISFPRIPLSQMFIWIATFQNLILDYKELKEGFANSIRSFFGDALTVCVLWCLSIL